MEGGVESPVECRLRAAAIDGGRTAIGNAALRATGRLEGHSTGGGFLAIAPEEEVGRREWAEARCKALVEDSGGAFAGVFADSLMRW
jgi:hypothetical protein